MDEAILVAFGIYLLSPERRARFENNTEPGMPPLQDRLAGVYREDLENFYNDNPEMALEVRQIPVG